MCRRPPVFRLSDFQRALPYRRRFFQRLFLFLCLYSRLSRLFLLRFFLIRALPVSVVFPFSYSLACAFFYKHEYPDSCFFRSYPFFRIPLSAERPVFSVAYFFEPAPFVFRSVSSAFSSFCGTTALFRGRRLIGAERLVLFGRGIFIAAKRTKGTVGRIYCRVQPARRAPGNFRSICFPRKNKKKRKNFAALDGIKLREELRERAKRTK